MAQYEYSVIPAPTKGVKAKGVKTAEGRFALALQQMMNEMGAEGWEYQRAETLPSVERSGFTGSATNWRHVLIFRRARPQDDAEDVPADTQTPAVFVAPVAPVAQSPEPADDYPADPPLTAPVHTEAAAEPATDSFVRREDARSDV